MRLEPTKCTVVVVGAWNGAIFTPPWVVEELGLKPDELIAELTIVAGNVLFRFITPRVTMELHPGRLQFAPTSLGAEFKAGEPEEAFRHVQEAATRVASRLPVTPLTAFGVNFGWMVQPSELRHDFVAVPEREALQRLGHTVEGVTVQRTLLNGTPGVRTTLKIATQSGQDVLIETNQHRTLTDAGAFAAELDVLKDYQRARDLVTTTYVRELADDL